MLAETIKVVVAIIMTRKGEDGAKRERDKCRKKERERE